MALNKLQIKINGSPMADKDMDDLIDLVVDTDAFLPAMVTFILKDEVTDSAGGFKFIDSSRFALGAALVISVGAQPSDEASELTETLFEGEITAIEPLFLSGGRAQLQIRGYDRSHRLTHARNTRTFLQMSEADILKKILQESGFTADVEQGSLNTLRYEYFIQYNQTDWEFLWEHARRFGYRIQTKDRKVSFKKLNSETPGRVIELTWGEDLTSFEPRISLAGQVTAVTATSWDPDRKEQAKSEVSSASMGNNPSISQSNSGSKAIQKVTSKVAEHIADQPFQETSVGKALADGLISARESDFIRATAYCEEGDPRIAAGKKVKIKNVGAKFGGTYLVTKATHHFQNGKYTTRFSLSGSDSDTIYNLLTHSEAQASGKMYGMVTAKITQINDPEKLGRVKVTFPWLSTELSTDWVRVVSPNGGKERGFLFLPEIDDEVLVAFDHGDPNLPYIIGSLWNKKDKPPTAGSGQVIEQGSKIGQRIIRSRSGHLIVLDDTQGSEQIIIKDKTGNNSIILNSKNNSITLKSQGDFIIEAGGKFTVKSQSNLEIQSSASSTLKSTGAMTVESNQSAVMKVSNYKVNVAMSGTELTGMKVDVKADTMASISGNAMVEVKGGLVKIN